MDRDILCHYLDTDEDGYIFVFSYVNSVINMLDEYKIKLSFEKTTTDYILNYTIKLINFLLYLIKGRKESLRRSEIYDDFSKDFNHLPFNFSKDEMFALLYKVHIEILESVSLERSKKMKIKFSNFQDYAPYFAFTISRTLERKLRVVGMELNDNYELIVNFYLRAAEMQILDYSQPQNVISYIKDIIMFYNQFNQYGFYYTMFEENNISPATKRLLRASIM